MNDPFGNLFEFGDNDNDYPQHGSLNPHRHDIWREDLESIRRERQVINSRFVQSIKVSKLDSVQRPDNRSNPGKTSVTSARLSDPEVVVLSDDDDNSAGGGDPAAALQAFYGQQGAAQETVDRMIRYQDHNQAHQNKYPSRKNGLGFDMAALRRDKNWASSVETIQQAQPTWDKDMFMNTPLLGFDEAVTRNWSMDSFTESLLYGFPLVETVTFYRPGNYQGARSACFFKAIAYLMYGHHSFNMRVQAEHLQYYGDVLEWEDHPRHQLYTRMNKKFYDTTISTAPGTSAGSNTEVDTVANFFQLLSIPQVWMPLDMLDVTADLYNLFIVVYTVRASSKTDLTVTEVSTKGSYNARHVFLLFNGVHYQPMVPNDYLASEFTFPRVTYENVNTLPSSGDADFMKSSVDLCWRNTWGAGLDRRKGALPVDHVFYRQTLRNAMSGSILSSGGSSGN